MAQQPELPQKVIDQMANAGLPQGGTVPFIPRLRLNNGELEIDKDSPHNAPRSSSKRRKKGYVDVKGRIWIRDHAHGNYPEHWDVQIDGGSEYIKVDLNGNELI